MNRKRSSEGQAPLAHLGQGGNISKEFMWPGRSRGSLTPLVKTERGWRALQPKGNALQGSGAGQDGKYQAC